QIGNVPDPTFDELKAKVPLSGRGVPLDFIFGPPGGPRIETKIEPRRNADDEMPVIGIRPAYSLELPPDNRRAEGEAPVFAHSAAAQAKPGFQFGDEIVATTDPENPAKITPLMANQHNPGSKSRDYFQFRERLAKLAGKEVVIEVMRKDASGQP